MCVPIAELPLPLPLGNKSSSNPKAIPTSPSAVRLAAKLEKPTATEAEAEAEAVAIADRSVRCSLLYVLNVASKPKFRLNLAKANRCIVAIATAKSERADASTKLHKSLFAKKNRLSLDGRGKGEGGIEAPSP